MTEFKSPSIIDDWVTENDIYNNNDIDHRKLYNYIHKPLTKWLILKSQPVSDSRVNENYI